ncbi:MAG: hypothetical protein PHU25_04735 [Deltaproteobacteria bacterium]|nr:hypothetical protein [Deltaproteobacteria bacterium]
MRYMIYVWMALAAVLVCACGDDDDSAPITDGGMDAGEDGGDDGGTGTDTQDTDTGTDTGTGEDNVPPDLPALCKAVVVNQPASGKADGRTPDLAVADADAGLLVYGYNDVTTPPDWDVEAKPYAPGEGLADASVEPVPAPVLGEEPSLAARGGEFGLVWLDTRWDPACDPENQDACRRDIAFTRLGPDGLPADGAVATRVTLNANVKVRPVIAATDSGFLVVWNDGSASEAVVRAVGLDPLGGPAAVQALSGEESIVAHTVPAIAAMGDTAVVAWLRADQQGIAARAVGADATPFGSVTVVDEGVLASVPGIAAGEDGFLVSWSRETNGEMEVFTRRLDPNGAPSAPAARATWVKGDVTQSRPAWNGTGFGLAWLSQRDNGTDKCAETSCENQVFVSLLDAYGVPVSRAVRLSDNPNVCVDLAFAWDGGGFAAAWELLRDMRWQIYWGRAVCE